MSHFLHFLLPDLNVENQVSNSILRCMDLNIESNTSSAAWGWGVGGMFSQEMYYITHV